MSEIIAGVGFALFSFPIYIIAFRYHQMIHKYFLGSIIIVVAYILICLIGEENMHFVPGVWKSFGALVGSFYGYYYNQKYINLVTLGYSTQMIKVILAASGVVLFDHMFVFIRPYINSVTADIIHYSLSGFWILFIVEYLLQFLIKLTISVLSHDIN